MHELSNDKEQVKPFPERTEGSRHPTSPGSTPDHVVIDIPPELTPPSPMRCCTDIVAEDQVVDSSDFVSYDPPQPEIAELRRSCRERHQPHWLIFPELGNCILPWDNSTHSV